MKSNVCNLQELTRCSSFFHRFVLSRFVERIFDECVECFLNVFARGTARFKILQFALCTKRGDVVGRHKSSIDQIALVSQQHGAPIVAFVVASFSFFYALDVFVHVVQFVKRKLFVVEFAMSENEIVLSTSSQTQEQTRRPFDNTIRASL